MQLSFGDILSVISIITTLASVFIASNVFMRKFGHLESEVKNLGLRVDKLEIRMDKLESRMDKLEKKVDEIIYFLSRKTKKHKWKH
jgi:hypothetical protein